MNARRAVLGIDVGGTTAKGAVVSVDGTVLCREQASTGTGGAALKSVGRLAASLAARTRAGGAELLGAGVISPGVVDPTGTRIAFASNLEWHDVPLRDVVMTQAGCPASLGHDARAAGQAEGILGAAKGCRNYAHISIGTGIGASLMVDGQILAGANSAAGEIGHATVFPDGDLCKCGRRGCLDAYAAAAGLVRRYRELTGDTNPTLSVEDLLARLGENAAADAVWNAAILGLARAITTLTMTIDPELVVLGGGVALAGDLLTEPLRSQVAASLDWKPAPRIVTSALGSLAGVAGALVVAMHELGRQADLASWDAKRLLAAAPVL